MAGPYGFFDPRNPLFGGAPVPPMGRQPGPLPTPAADAARAAANAAMPTPGYATQALANPGIYAKQTAPPGGIPGYGGAGQGVDLMGMGKPPTAFNTQDPAVEQFMQMRSGGPLLGGSPTVTGPAAPPMPARPRAGGGSVTNSARTPAPVAAGAPAGHPQSHEPATPDGGAAPAVPDVPAAAMAEGDPDKQDFLDMQGAISNWQMGMGGTGQRMTDANRLQQTGADIDAAAQIRGRHPVNQLTRALGGIGSGYAIDRSNKERKLIKETTDQLRNTARAELERIREKRRGGKTPAAPASALDRAFAQSGDVSAPLDADDPYKGYW